MIISTPCPQVIPVASEEQLLLVELVRSVSAMRTETVMQTVKEVLKQPPAIAKDKVGVAVAISLNGFISISFAICMKPFKTVQNSLAVLTA